MFSGVWTSMPDRSFLTKRSRMLRSRSRYSASVKARVFLSSIDCSSVIRGLLPRQFTSVKIGGAVDVDCRTGGMARQARSQERDHVGDIFGPRHFAQWDVPQHHLFAATANNVFL